MIYDDGVRPSPTSIFVLTTLALAGAVAVTATRTAHGAGDGGEALPSDAASFGFVVQGRANGVPLLESTRAFEITLANGRVHGAVPSETRRKEASEIVARELGRYPGTFLRKIRLAGVVLTDDLGEGETPIPSLPNVGGLLLLDVSSVESDLVRTLHHEVYHFFDLADDGRVSPDPAWESLNAPRFAYGSGGRTLRGAWAGRPSSDIPGFISAYATSGPEEDKAETFALAVARPLLIATRMTTDIGVRAKVAELSRRLAKMDPDTPHRLGFDDLALR